MQHSNVGDFREIAERMERNHPELKRASVSHAKTLEQMFGNERAREMRREAAIVARVDRLKLGGDY